MSEYLDSLLQITAESGASDLHLRAGDPPRMRVDGALRPVPGASDPPGGESMRVIADEILSPRQQQELDREKTLDFSYRAPVGRFRANLFWSSGEIAATFRAVSETPPTLADIEAPAGLIGLSRENAGLILVTGPTGSGKTTTLAAMLDLINSERDEHILTIEDPVEYVHTSRRCLVSQREIGRDAVDFKSALRSALREDPDVILVGELRDFETVSIALTAAETGHLVLGTLHTSSAPGSIDRMIDAFPPEQQQQARVMLAGSLAGIVSQSLLPRKDRAGRIAAHEIMVSTNPVRALIRKQDTAQLRSVIQTGMDSGMQTMDRSLVALVADGKVAEDVAYQRCQNHSEFEQLLRLARSGKPVDTQPRVTASMLQRKMEQSLAPGTPGAGQQMPADVNASRGPARPMPGGEVSAEAPDSPPSF